MKEIRFILVLIILTSCSTKQRIPTDLQKMGLSGKIKSVKFITTPEKKNALNSDTDIKSTESVRYDLDYDFDKNGMIQVLRYYSSETLSKRVHYLYNEKDLLKSKLYYNAQGDLLYESRSENIFNKEGFLVKEIEYFSIDESPTDSLKLEDRITPKYSFNLVYDDSGVLIELVYSQIYDGRILQKQITQYEEGKQVRILRVDGSGKVLNSSAFECLKNDEKGNCIKMRDISGDNRLEIINADLKYY